MTDLLIDKQGHTTIFTLTRPERMNALSSALMRDLQAGLQEFQSDPDQYVAIITGAGDKAFCSGGDLKEMAASAATGKRLSDVTRSRHCRAGCVREGHDRGGQRPCD